MPAEPRHCGWGHAVLVRVFLFFQAEDGIRDSSVTGVQTCALPIVPFTRRVEFLEDVVYEAVFVVHTHAAVVLPATLIGDVAVRVLSGDHVVEIAPHIPMHGVYVAAAWILPPGGALIAEGIPRPTI